MGLHSLNKIGERGGCSLLFFFRQERWIKQLWTGDNLRTADARVEHLFAILYAYMRHAIPGETLLALTQYHRLAGKASKAIEPCFGLRADFKGLL